MSMHREEITSAISHPCPFRGARLPAAPGGRAAALVLGIVCALLQPSPAKAAGAFSDNDEGSTGPIQDQFENQIVFAHAYIERTDKDPKKIISETTLKEPIFIRFFRSKTPARILHERGQDNCLGAQRFDRTWAHLEASPQDRVLLNDASFGDKTFKSARSSSIVIQNNKVSLLPLERLRIDLAEMEQKAFVALVANMKPGSNKVIFENYVGCQEITKTDKPVATGALTFVVKKGDLAAYAKLIGPDFEPGEGDGATQSRIEERFRKSMVKGSKIIKLVTDSTETEPMESQTTPVRALLRNAEGTCSYVEGWWRQKHLGGGKFDSGSFDAGQIKGFGNQIPVPCP